MSNHLELAFVPVSPASTKLHEVCTLCVDCPTHQSEIDQGGCWLCVDGATPLPTYIEFASYNLHLSCRGTGQYSRFYVCQQYIILNKHMYYVLQIKVCTII